MTKEEIHQIVSAVLEEEAVRRGAAIDEVVLKAVATILTSFGIEEDDRKELQADFIHLRKWRKSVEQAQSLTFRVVLTDRVWLRRGLLARLQGAAEQVIGLGRSAGSGL